MSNLVFNYSLLITRYSLPKMILASASPRREELLRQIGLDFEVIPSNFDETGVTPWPPETHVLESSTNKAADVAARVSDGLIIGADTIVVVDDQILQKPEDHEDAREMLRLISGRSHYVYTGLCVIERSGGESVKSDRDYVRTEVVFGELTDEIIDSYVATGEPMDKAGAYGIQELGGVLVKGVVGDYSNVVGLPIFRLSRILLEFGVPLFGK